MSNCIKESGPAKNAGLGQQATVEYSRSCPVCESSEFEFLSRVWKNYHREWEVELKDDEWFVECRRCGTIVRFPLIDYGADFRKYGEDYYNQGEVDGSVDEHAQRHFEQFQKGNYDSIRTFFRGILPPQTYPRWLDVGSVGYPTTFDDYDFTTIEPDERAVKVGRRLFGRPPRWFRSKIVAATIETYETRDKFDGILFNNSFYCLTTPDRALEAARKLLKPDGRVVITISTRLNGAVQNRDDGLISRIEDVLVGETLWVFYNEFSLRYLLARHGFELETAKEIPAYGKKTMVAYVFKTNGGVTSDDDWLNRSLQHMRETMDEVFADMDGQTEATLRAINKPSTLLVGSLRILLDLSRRGKLDQVAGAVCVDAVVDGATDGNLEFIDWSDLAELVARREPGYFEVVLCAYREQEELRQRVRRELGGSVRILVPNRRSGIESMDMVLGGRIVPVKGFSLVNGS